MDIRKYQFNIFCLLLFPLSATGQEWNKQDSLRLQQMLESDQEIKINRKLIEKVEQKMYSRKPFVDFDPTLPTLKSSMIFSKPSIRTYQTFLKPGSTFLPTYSWLRINKNLVLHSKSNFAENSSCFHISKILLARDSTAPTISHAAAMQGNTAQSHQAGFVRCCRKAIVCKIGRFIHQWQISCLSRQYRTKIVRQMRRQNFFCKTS